MKLRSKLFGGYLFSLIVYSGFILLPAPSPVTLLRYHVSVVVLRIIYITIILLLAGIWWAGFYGYAKLRAYTQLIRGDKDGVQIAKLANGLFLLVLWLPVSSVVSAILNYVAMKHPGALPAVAIINNYISLLLPLFGFIFIGRGAHGLNGLVRQRISYKAINALAIFLIYIGVVYYHLVASTQNRTAVYHMSLWLILTTLIAPYIYMWFIGLLAAYEIYIYQWKVKGIVYKKSWRLLAFGLGWLIIMSIVVQYLTSLLARFSHLSIYAVLAIIYSLLLVLSVGFVLIAVGARKLQLIEEV